MEKNSYWGLRGNDRVRSRRTDVRGDKDDQERKRRDGRT